MSERHLIAYAILLVVPLALGLTWWGLRHYRKSRLRRGPERHLRIDLLADAGEEPTAEKP